jgi:probable F420-dependent oxidoreductase
MTAAAAATERLLVGSGICLVAQRDPIVTAKALASIEHLLQGRVLFGVGAGWNEEEMENHGVQPGRRFGVMREHVEAIRAIWTQERASYHGAHVDFDAIYSWPKPVQDPHPPVLVGGNGRTVLDRVLAYGGSWYPNRFGDDDRFIARIDTLQRRARRSGPRPGTGHPATRADRARAARALRARRCHLRPLVPPRGPCRRGGAGARPLRAGARRRRRRLTPAIATGCRR